ncbi:restriction endonuclease subunit S [Microbulbifer thermotolerans]|uniref:restriction endonuclease subunit S n=1 Tax=Microbulbifer thermotolerans TaxID=252514 RepID=UPI00224B41F4|nr:restriction endonuclease subunit S [Microbulbifer thermotolerans]MCX2782242.1 restriction endonuclease subunit S [Microbulbifer thermotolerans]
MSWPTEKLKVVAPAKPLKSVGVSKEENVLQITLDHIESNYGRLIKRNYAPVSQAGNSTHWFTSKHVLYSKLRPYLNKVYLPEEMGICTTELVPMLPDEKVVDRRYLAYYLRSKTFVDWVSSQTAGAKMPRVSMKVFWEHKIPLPPLAEQKRIAAILDKADAIRRKRQQAIQLADEFLRAVFLDMFGDPVTNPKGWDIEKIENLCEVQGGIQVSKKRENLPLSAPYLRVANVLRNRLDLSEIKNIKLTSSEYERVKLKKDDVLIVEGHGNPSEIGRSAICTKRVDGMVHQNHLIRVRVNNKRIRPLFINDYINSSGGRVQMMKASNTTSGLNTISTGIVRDTEIAVPPIDLQDKYLNLAGFVNNIIMKCGNHKNGVDVSFLSLSQKAFRGEL